MPAPSEHKTVQARILAYAQEIGSSFVSRDEAERQRGVDSDGITSEDCAMLPQLMTTQILARDLNLLELWLDGDVPSTAEGASKFLTQ